MPSDILPHDTDLSAAYPTGGVRIAINVHHQTLGGHRVKISIDPGVASVLRRGLHMPRVLVDGTVSNGLRIWCAEAGGLAPIHAQNGRWYVTLPVRRLRAREETVGSEDVATAWERDETGPVLLIPRLPDRLLPERVVEKLPNSMVDQDTRHQRAEYRLQRELARVNGKDLSFTPAPSDGVFHVRDALTPQASDQASLGRIVAQVEPADALTPAALVAQVEPAEAAPPQPEEFPPNLVDAPTGDAVDLKAAIEMVNELADRIGDGVVLTIEHGRVRARRRVVGYVDL